MSIRSLLFCACLLTTSLVPAAAQETASIMKDAVAVWHMKSADDGAGANSRLEPIGDKTAFGVKLDREDATASLQRGGDGYAARFSNGALLVGQGANGEINLKGKELTILLRLKSEGDSWDVTLFSKHGGHERLQYNIFCFGMPDGALDLGFEIGTTEGFVKAPAIIPADRMKGWHDIVARFDGSRAELYFDGEACASVPLSGLLRPGSDSPLIIGGESGGDGVARRFTGMIDHAVLWNRALTADEIAQVSGRQTQPLYQEPYRPQVHFSPERNWINDPNGLVFHDGEYHLFYQYNPFGNQWGHMSWGHAVSRDLMHWKHLPVALPEEDGIMIFSGSAVSDDNNTSGFGKDGATPLVAIYSGHDTHLLRQTQNLAFSLDKGRTWTKYEGNPVIDLDAEHFRDPKVFWHQPDKRWVMVVSLADKKKVQFYGSADLKQWEHLSDFGPAGAPNVPNWECPDLFELPVDGNEDATRWVLQVDVGDNAPAGGSGGQYFVGEFDGRTFRNDNASDTILWVDHGADFYAVQSFSGIPSGDGRTLWLAWMSNWRYASAIPTYPWRGSMTLPREVGLTRTAEGVRLVQQPAREIEKLRGKPVVKLGGVEIKPGTDPLDERDVEGRVLDIEADFAPGKATRFGIRVREGKGACTIIGYDVRLREMFVDRRKSGRVDFHPDFAGFHSAPLPLGKNGRVSLRVIVDDSSVAVFGNDGRAVITDRIFPDASQTGVSLFAEEGAARLDSISICPLESIWRSATAQSQDPRRVVRDSRL